VNNSTIIDSTKAIAAGLNAVAKAIIMCGVEIKLAPYHKAVANSMTSSEATKFLATVYTDTNRQLEKLK